MWAICMGFSIRVGGMLRSLVVSLRGWWLVRRGRGMPLGLSEFFSGFGFGFFMGCFEGSVIVWLLILSVRIVPTIP